MIASASAPGQQEVDRRAASPVGRIATEAKKSEDDDRDHDRDQHVLAAPRGQPQLHRGLGERRRGQRAPAGSRRRPRDGSVAGASPDELEVGVLERCRRRSAARRSAARRRRTTRRARRRASASGAAPRAGSGRRRRRRRTRDPEPDRRRAPLQSRHLVRGRAAGPAGTGAAAVTPAAAPPASRRRRSGRGRGRTIRSASRSTSVRSWLVSRIATPVAAQVRDDRRGSRPAPPGPCPAVGSSRIDDLGPADEREREPEPLALAAGQPPVAGPRHRPQPDQLEQLVRRRAGRRGSGRTGGASRAARPAGRCRRPGASARPAPGAPVRPSPDPSPRTRTAPAVRAPVALDDLDRRRLARAVRSEQRDELAGADRRARRRRGRLAAP